MIQQNDPTVTIDDGQQLVTPSIPLNFLCDFLRETVGEVLHSEYYKRRSSEAQLADMVAIGLWFNGAKSTADEHGGKVTRSFNEQCVSKLFELFSVFRRLEILD